MPDEILPIEAFGAAEGKGLQRTELHCHNCSKSFVAELDFDINGKHSIVCPRCNHIHCREIKDGKVTGDRWDTVMHTDAVAKASTWKSSVLAARTSTVSQFLRDKWLNRVDSP